MVQNSNRSPRLTVMALSAFLSLFLISSSAYALTINVVDKDTNEPLVATIKACFDNCGAATTGSNGIYNVVWDLPTEYTVESVGYYSTKKTLSSGTVTVGLKSRAMCPLIREPYCSNIPSSIDANGCATDYQCPEIQKPIILMTFYDLATNERIGHVLVKNSQAEDEPLNKDKRRSLSIDSNGFADTFVNGLGDTVTLNFEKEGYNIQSRTIKVDRTVYQLPVGLERATSPVCPYQISVGGNPNIQWGTAYSGQFACLATRQLTGPAYSPNRNVGVDSIPALYECLPDGTFELVKACSQGCPTVIRTDQTATVYPANSCQGETPPTKSGQPPLPAFAPLQPPPVLTDIGNAINDIIADLLKPIKDFICSINPSCPK